MSCPDWVRLTAHRFDRSCEESPEWGRALEHLDHCSACRRAALAVDPTLLFRESLGQNVKTAKKEVDVESILVGVRVLRRASPKRRSHIWSETAAAAALLVLGLWVAPASVPPLKVQADDSVPIPYVENLPVVETIDRPEARIYQLADDELSMVMIVDETLDV